ncbi:MAG: TetR/AcrR family transcriptional regulator [Planctomycetota bacterium]|nr:TetR/AcrR family transcriptional regulator [Planctomycetota bacterium]
MSDSTRSSRRYLKGEQTREQIVQAARKLFTQRGYHNTSIYDLFELSGISKGAFYHHWKTKEDLAFTILEEMRKAYETRIFAVIETEGRARDQIERMLQTIVELNADPEWHYCKLLATWSSELGPNDGQLGAAIHEIRARWQTFWETLLRRAQDQNDLRSDLPARQLSFLVISAICGVYLTGKQDGVCQEGPNAMETLRKLLFT